MDETNQHCTTQPALIQGALAAWREALGPDRVITAGERLEFANQATFETTQHSLAILEPVDRDEVVACLRVAHHFHVPLYPVSRGLNWGYGSRVPPRDGCILLSLARLDRIVDYHEELAYVTVEPGVTFRRLSEFLRDQGSRLLPPITGTSPDASLVGNVLERGIGKGPYEDMAAHSCAYEVILPTGKIVQTGFANLSGAMAAALVTSGPGPSLQGLFHQSNLGVVTRMTLWLERAPRWRQLVVFSIRDQENLSAVVEALRETLQRSGSELQVELINDYRFLAQTRQYPYEEFDGSTPLPNAWVREKLRPLLDARWIGGATLWADSEEELELRRRKLTSSLPSEVEGLRYEEPVAGLDFSLSSSGIQTAYWRKRRPMPPDPHPDRDRCGVIWLAPVLPMLGSVTARVVEQIEGIMLDSGFEPLISLRLGGRSIQVVVGLCYDRDDIGMDTGAIRCYDALHETLYRQGIYPYRLGLRDMDSLPMRDDGSEEVLRSFKALLDPHGILAPGRYIPSERSQ